MLSIINRGFFQIMKLVMNKAKRETIATYISGVSILILISSFGYYIYLPISKLISYGQFLPIRNLFPVNEIFHPFLGFFLSGILFLLSKKLRNDTSRVAILYERLGPGTLLLILLFLVWTFPLVFSLFIKLLF